MTSLLPDVRFAARMLWKHKTLTASALATISLAIAANTAIFSLVSSVLLRRLALPQPERVVRVEERHEGRALNLTGATFADVRERVGAFSAAASFRLNSPGLAAGDVPEQVTAAQVSSEYFAVLSTPPLLGRTFEPADFAPGARPTVLLTEDVWRRSFGGDRDAVGRTVLVNAVPTEIVGVMPAAMFAPGSPRIWIPQTPQGTFEGNRRAHLFFVVARVRRDVSLEAARQELETVSSQIRDDSGEVDPGLALGMTPLHEWLAAPVRPALLMLWAAVGLLLVIGATNVANLLLMQGASRTREIGIRTALGAPRARLLRQFAVEAVLLGAAGGALGTLLGIWAVPVLRMLVPASLSRSVDISADGGTLIFGFLLSMFTTVCFGVAPAIRASSAPAADALRDRESISPARSALRTAFVTAQVGVTVLLLTGAALLARSFLLVTRMDPGFDPSGTLAFDVTLPSATYPDARAHAAFLTRLVEQVRSIPGVQHAGAAGALPLGGIPATTMVPEGGDPDADLSADVIPSSPGHIEALRIPLKAGRLFTQADHERGVPVMLVSEHAARAFWPTDPTPLGRRVTMRNWGEPYTAEVVGVVGDVRQAGPDADIRSAVYYPLQQFPETLIRYSIVLRAPGDPRALAAAAREAVWRADRTLPVASMRTMGDAMAAAVAARRFNLLLIGAFAIAALGLAAMGLYGILAFAVGQRTRELGVRIALGAGATDIVHVVWTHGAVPVLLGLAAGLAGAVAGSRVIRGLLFGIEGADTVTFGVVAALMLLVAGVASLGPIRRALTIDPAAVLRG